MTHPVPASIWRNPIHFLAFGLGSGAAPKAPGTFGTLAAIIPFFFIWQYLSDIQYFFMLVAASLLGIFLCHKTAKDLGVHDHSGIVWDEFVGFWITMWLAPTGWLYIAVGFVLFRLFDILKPWPISWFDKNVHGGFGIMIDDILAGVAAFAVMQLLAHFVW
ncbi:Phosphatidylglycerophosphatase A [Marinomonas spartinae]|uniref:Phosphatidylglycerophosphatase A n=1 Tax=Marinomonas spartinae TaxID=1792290 RepID=A0A1A8TSN3_9GAMM|nr:phosphatidylglycerophosphatase A [Marinomonas spartinae]SBS37298.1 Phosphatidylglycerophosphatase A [Marinomonas spartinae]SBS39020.1 Phosphatidylglycerophosphatase A [Marinomonas spartinae]